MKLGVTRLRKRLDAVQQFDPSSAALDPEGATTALRVSIDDALSRTFGDDTVEYQRFSGASHFIGRSSYEVEPSEVKEALSRSKSSSIAVLGQAIESPEERIAEIETTAPPFTTQIQNIGPHSKEIFLVHGHNSGVKETVARFIERIGFIPVVLHEQANRGRTIIEKFEAHAQVGFAVVLLTPDDVGGPDGELQQPRARQNVILELGYFIGKLGRQNVCAVKVGNLDLPSDILGVVWSSFDSSGAWKQELARELDAAGFSVDWNTVMGQ